MTLSFLFLLLSETTAGMHLLVEVGEADQLADLHSRGGEELHVGEAEQLTDLHPRGGEELHVGETPVVFTGSQHRHPEHCLNQKIKNNCYISTGLQGII